MCGWDMVHVTLHWGIGNGLTHDWQHTDDGLALDCPSGIGTNIANRVDLSVVSLYGWVDYW